MSGAFERVQAVKGEPKAISVGELTGHIKAILEGTFPNICVAGEISDLSRPRSGHLYFTLKDDHAQIRGVIWRSTAVRLSHKIEEGESVLCFGDVEVYAARGAYQLIVRQVQPQGLGALQRAFQQLQAKLQAEGLFTAERKRELPRFPQRIGIVTSPDGAAIRDFLKAAGNRYRGVDITVIPALVQGPEAARSIVRGIRAAHRLEPRLDVLVLSRGGGSLEDLWSFNEEIVVREVAESSIPTVSAVGHEVDITLCDLAADVRALTPTDAATRVLPDADALRRSVSDLTMRFDRSMRFALRTRRAAMESLANRTALRKPHELVHSRSRFLDELDARAQRAVRAKLQLSQAKLATASASLSALSPLDVLTRGYSMTLDEHGNAISDPNQVQPGDIITTRMKEGQIKSTVDKVEPDS
ncbi:MAG: exodeoxyribonuclease VII large subunit [Planctomycetota bacterium]